MHASIIYSDAWLDDLLVRNGPGFAKRDLEKPKGGGDLAVVGLDGIALGPMCLPKRGLG